MYTRRAAPELHTELKADTGRYVDVHSLCIAMRLGRAASVEVALIRDALCRSALEIRYTQQGSMYDVWVAPLGEHGMSNKVRLYIVHPIAACRDTTHAVLYARRAAARRPKKRAFHTKRQTQEHAFSPPPAARHFLEYTQTPPGR
jgi:hypothetical protein